MKIGIVYVYLGVTCFTVTYTYMLNRIINKYATQLLIEKGKNFRLSLKSSNSYRVAITPFYNLLYLRNIFRYDLLSKAISSIETYVEAIISKEGGICKDEKK